MNRVQLIEIQGHEEDLRFDRWTEKHFPNLPYGKLQKLLRSGQFRLDGGRIKASTRVHEGQKVRVPPFEEGKSGRTVKAPVNPEKRAAERSQLEDMIIHQDDRVIILNKPPGLAVQGGTKTTRHIDGLLAAFEKNGERPRLVHRLDRDTSGVLVLAKNRSVARDLSFAFQSHRARKLYWAIVLGIPARPEGVIDMALAKKGGAGSERMHANDADGKSARTLFHVLDRSGRLASWLALVPITGRTHQLRAHCAAMGTPIFGDRKYGESKAFDINAPAGLMLHAREILLDLPDGRKVRAKADPPDTFKAGLRWLGIENWNPSFAGLDDWLNEKNTIIRAV